MNELYQEYGEILYKIRKFDVLQCSGEVIVETETNGVQKLWD